MMADMTTKTFKHGTNGYTNYKCRCDVCVAAKSAAAAVYREANKEKVAASDAAYQAANKEKLAAQKAKYRAANKEKAAAYQAEYRAANPDKRAASDHRRRARKAGNGVWDILPGEWDRLVERYRGCCAYCGVADDNLTMDHVVPVAKGGRHAIGNFVPACQSCNSSKNDRYLSQWKLWKVKVGK